MSLKNVANTLFGGLDKGLVQASVGTGALCSAVGIVTGFASNGIAGAFLGAVVGAAIPPVGIGLVATGAHWGGKAYDYIAG